MSRNYKEDQTNEVEALDSIYCGEMEIMATEPFHKFKIPIATEEFYADEEENGIACKLLFTYTAKYPDEAPAVEIEDTINFEDSYETSVLEHLRSTIEENLGMEMIFSLVSSAQEWLNVRWDEHKQELENERARKVIELEALELKKFEGTRVTVESFLAWKTEFEEDTGVAARREKITDCKKLTGKELFLRDTTLNDSDIKYLMEVGESIENVKIDETLFQNLGELEMGSEDEDDEDWQPGDDDEDD